MDEKIILEGVVGSKAYGIDTPESDTDMMGIFLHPTVKTLSLHKGEKTIFKTNPNLNSHDIKYHEVEKYFTLALKCNPTILELMYLNEYTALTREGQMLIDIRDSFLHTSIYLSYGKYALNEAKELYNKHEIGETHTRHKQHARHCFRLLQQGRELLENSVLNVKVEDLEILFNISDMEINDMMRLFSTTYEEFKEIKTSLPDEPDYKRINDVLIKIRRMNL